MSTTWKWKVIDEDVVPQELFIIDNLEIDKLVRRGERNIKGIKIYSEQTVSIR